MLVLWCASFRKLHCTLSNFLFLPRALIPNPLALEQGNQYYHAVTRMVAEETTASTPGGFTRMMVCPSTEEIRKAVSRVLGPVFELEGVPNFPGCQIIGTCIFCMVN